MSIHQEYITQHKLEQTNLINQSNKQPNQPVNTSKGKKLSIITSHQQGASGQQHPNFSASSLLGLWHRKAHPRWNGKISLFWVVVGTCDIDLRDSENFKKNIKHKNWILPLFWIWMLPLFHLWCGHPTSSHFIEACLSMWLEIRIATWACAWLWRGASTLAELLPTDHFRCHPAFVIYCHCHANAGSQKPNVSYKFSSWERSMQWYLGPCSRMILRRLPISGSGYIL